MTGGRAEAAAWARDVLSGDLRRVLILDSETTALDGEIVELAIITAAGDVVYNSRFNPISAISEGSRRVHGLTAKMLANEPRWADEHDRIREILTGADQVLIYNADFDEMRLHYTAGLHGCERFEFWPECIMQQYAAFVGIWSEWNYRWHPLPGGDHSALGDARAALAVVREMAGCVRSDNVISGGWEDV